MTNADRQRLAAILGMLGSEHERFRQGIKTASWQRRAAIMRSLKAEERSIRDAMASHDLIKPRHRTFWQKAGEAFGMLAVYTISFLLLVKFVAWLL